MLVEWSICHGPLAEEDALPMYWSIIQPVGGVSMWCGTASGAIAHSATAVAAPTARGTFSLDYRNHGRLPAVKQQMVDMALNGSGIRDTARVLRVSPTTVISTHKKKIEAYSK